MAVKDRNRYRTYFDLILKYFELDIMKLYQFVNSQQFIYINTINRYFMLYSFYFNVYYNGNQWFNNTN